MLSALNEIYSYISKYSEEVNQFGITSNSTNVPDAPQKIALAQQRMPNQFTVCSKYLLDKSNKNEHRRRTGL